MARLIPTPPTEIYFSIIQRKVLTPNDFPDLATVRTRLALYEELNNQTPRPFQWKFTRKRELVTTGQAAFPGSGYLKPKARQTR